MTTFDQREEGFENMFAHDEEVKFKADARRNRMVGFWAAEKLGLAGAAAEAYARSVIDANVEAPGGRAVIRKIATDLAAKNVIEPESTIQAKMDELLTIAIAQIKAGM